MGEQADVAITEVRKNQAEVIRVLPTRDQRFRSLHLYARPAEQRAARALQVPYQRRTLDPGKGSLEVEAPPGPPRTRLGRAGERNGSQVRAEARRRPEWLRRRSGLAGRS